MLCNSKKSPIPFSLFISLWVFSTSLPANAVESSPKLASAPDGRAKHDIPFGSFVQPPSLRLVLTNLFALRYNPLGLLDELRFGVQKALYRRESALLRDNFLNGGLLFKVAPTSVRVGGALEIQPLSIFSFRGTVEWMYHLKTFDSFQSFQSPSEDYSESTLSDRTDDGFRYTVPGLRAALEPSLQLRFPLGRKKADGAPPMYLVLRDKFSAEFNRISAVHDFEGRKDTVWYDIILDTLLSTNGWAIQNHVDLVLMTRIALIVGMRYTAVVPFYPRSDFRTSDEAHTYDNDNGHQRLGPVIAYTFFDRAYTKFNKPTLLFVANWYVAHRWKTGAETSAALPYLLLAFSFQSDFLNGPPLP